MDPIDTPPAAATAPGWRASWAAFPSRLKLRRKVRAGLPAPVPVAGPLRAFSDAALWGIALLIVTAAGAAFSESYQGLFEWAEHHNFSGFWAAAFPLQVDVFIAVGELVLFVAMARQWDMRDRLGAWTVALLGLAVSIAGNVGHAGVHDLQSRGTAAIPPLAAFAALWLGIGVVKRIVRRRRKAAEADAQGAQRTAERDALAGVLDELTGAVMLLANQAAVPAVQPPPDGTQTALLAELLAAVQGLAGRPGDASREPVPDSAEGAAAASYRATLAAGNPWSQRQLEARFGLTRSQAARVRDAADAPEPIRYAALSGAGAGA